MPLMTHEKYVKTIWKTPYTLVIKSGDNSLYYFGEEHIHDPAHPQWPKQKEFWESFLKNTEGQKRIVMVEGNSTEVFPGEDEAIRNCSGMGLAAFLASQQGIEIISPEMKTVEQLDLMRKEFSEDLAAYYYIVRQIPQWGGRMEPRPNFEEYIQKYLDFAKGLNGWEDYDFSLSHIKDIHKELFGQDFNYEDTKFFFDIVNPAHPERSIVNEVGVYLGDTRDKYIVDQIKRYIDLGYSIYAQFGFSHVIRQEPLLREILD